MMKHLNHCIIFPTAGKRERERERERERDREREMEGEYPSLDSSKLSRYTLDHSSLRPAVLRMSLNMQGHVIEIHI